jgi:hypothetical protein
MNTDTTLTLDEGDVEMLLHSLGHVPGATIERDGDRWERLTFALAHLRDTHRASGVRVEMGRGL